MSDWATIVSAVITGTATIAAILIAWFLTKKGLYKYQRLQDLKKAKVRLVKNVIDTKSKVFEAVLPLYVALKGESPKSMEEGLETVLKLRNSSLGFELLLEEIKIELTMSLPTFKKYSERMTYVFNGIMRLLFLELNEADETLNEKLDLYFNEATLIFTNLIQFIHKKKPSL